MVYREGTVIGQIRYMTHVAIGMFTASISLYMSYH